MGGQAATHDADPSRVPLAATPRVSPWPAMGTELRAGLNAAIVSLGVALPLGVIALAPLGPAFVGAGVQAALISAIVGNVAASLVGGIRLPNSGPRASVTLIFAAFVAALAGAIPVAARNADALAGVLFLGAVGVMAAGLLQALFGALRLGGLVKFVPYPVVAGFMNGVAILIVLSQLPALLGTTVVDWHPFTRDGWATVEPASALIGAGTAIAIAVIAHRFRNAPAFLIGLALGTAAWLALDAAFPGMRLGDAVGEIPGTLRSPMLPIERGVALLAEHFVQVATMAVVLAIVGSMDALLAAVAVDSVIVERHDSNRLLLGQGIANVVSGALGGIPVSYSTAIAVATMNAGGRTWIAGVLASALLVVAAIAARPMLAILPLAALAGVMLVVAASLADRWTRVVVRQVLAGQANAETGWGLAVVLLVCVVTVAFGFIVAVAAGVVVSMIVFIASMNRSLVRARSNGASRSSRRTYPPDALRCLREHGAWIQTLELEGALFFGTAERLSIEVEALVSVARFVVLDLRRITTIDASGAVILERLWRQLANRQVALLLAGVGAGERHGVALLACGTFADATARPWYASVDEALEHAERQVLDAAGIGPSPAGIAIGEVALLDGLDEPARASVVAHLERIGVPRGTVLFRAGDPGDRMYIVTQGSVSIRYREGQRHGRLITCAPGVVFGELAMLDGAGRSADAVADEDSIVYALTQERLDAIRAHEPALASQLLLNLARQLSVYLRFASANLREADR